MQRETGIHSRWRAPASAGSNPAGSDEGFPCGHGSVAEQKPSKLNRRVRFPLPAPVFVGPLHRGGQAHPDEHSLDKREADRFESYVHYQPFFAVPLAERPGAGLQIRIRPVRLRWGTPALENDFLAVQILCRRGPLVGQRIVYPFHEGSIPFVGASFIAVQRGNSSVGRAPPCHGGGREFEARFPLQLSLFAGRVRSGCRYESIRASTWSPGVAHAVRVCIPAPDFRCIRNNTSIAQLEEFRATNAGVAGSSPAGRTRLSLSVGV